MIKKRSMLVGHLSIRASFVIRHSCFVIRWDLCPSEAATESCPAHIGAGAGVDPDRFAFFDEQRDVDCLSRLKECRLGHIAGSITAQSLWRFNYLETDRRRQLNFHWFAFCV